MSRVEESVGAEQIDLHEYLRILGRRKTVVGLMVVVVVGLSLAYSFVAPPVYEATATVLVPQQQAASALNNTQAPNAQNLQRNLADEQQFAKSDAVRNAAAKSLGYRASVRVKISSTADILTFAASSGKGTRAADVANAFAGAYITARRANQVAQYTQQVTALEKSIANLQSEANTAPAGTPERSALEQSIATLTQTVEQTQAAGQLANQVGPTVTNAARVPISPKSPNPTRNGLLGLVVGLILGVGLAFLVERLDDGINSREAAQKATGGVPVVGLIPLVPAWRTKGAHHIALIEDSASNVAEAYRTLRTSVQFLGIDEPMRVVGITSSVPDEGKTTAVANLAVSFARAGQRVVVVSCDLRRPRIHDFFGVSNQTGLTSVLLGEVDLSHAVLPVQGEPHLRILPSGPVPPNPAEILSLDRVREVVNALAHNADLVLLDCPPVLPVTDALLLSRLVDGMLILVAAQATSKRDPHRSFELLRQVQTPILGTIVNRVPTEAWYAYGYGYYGSYHYEEASTGSGWRKDRSHNTVPITDALLSPLGAKASPLRNGHNGTGQPSVGGIADDYSRTGPPSPGSRDASEVTGDDDPADAREDHQKGPRRERRHR